MNLTPEQIKRGKKYAQLVDKGGVAIIDYLFEIEDKFDERAKEMKSDFTDALNEVKANVPDLDKVLETVKGKDGKDSKVPGPEGKKGDPGKDGADGRNGKDGRDGKDGRNGADGKNGLNGKDGKNGLDVSRDTAAEIVVKLESLKGDDRLDKSAIKGLEELVSTARSTSTHPIVGGPVRRKLRAVSLTSQCNSVTKAFTLPLKTMSVIGVFGTQYPLNFDPINDWTVSGRTLTLGALIPAPETNQTLWTLIETL